MRVQYGLHELPAPTTAELTRRLDPRAYALPPGERPLNIYIGGPEAQFAVIQTARLKGVLSARINYARRTFGIDHAASGTATYQSRAWGMGGAAGIELALFSRLAVEATAGHDWLYFNEYPNLDLPDLRTAATWKAFSFRLGLSFAAVRGE